MGIPSDCRRGYRLGGLIPQLLRTHESAWLYLDDEAANQLGEMMSWLVSEGHAQESLAQPVRGALDEDFGSLEHRQWSVAFRFCDKPCPLAEWLSTATKEACCLVDERIRGQPNPVRRLQEALHDLFKDQGPFLVRHLIDWLSDNGPHILYDEEPKQGEKLRTVVREVLEKMAHLHWWTMDSRVFFEDLDEQPIPRALWDHESRPRPCALAESPAAEPLTDMCRGILEDCLSQDHPVPLWFCLGFHLELARCRAGGDLYMPKRLRVQGLNPQDDAAALAGDELERLADEGHIRETALPADRLAGDDPFGFEMRDWVNRVKAAIRREFLFSEPGAPPAPPHTIRITCEERYDEERAEERPFVVVRIRPGGREWKLDLWYKSGQNVKKEYGLFWQLLETLRRDKKDEQKWETPGKIGWTMYAELGGTGDGKVTGKVKNMRSRLNGIIPAGCREYIRVSQADPNRGAYRLEGLVLRPNWSLEVELPPPEELPQ